MHARMHRLPLGESANGIVLGGKLVVALHRGAHVRVTALQALFQLCNPGLLCNVLCEVVHVGGLDSPKLLLQRTDPHFVCTANQGGRGG